MRQNCAPPPPPPPPHPTKHQKEVTGHLKDAVPCFLMFWKVTMRPQQQQQQQVLGIYSKAIVIQAIGLGLACGSSIFKAAQSTTTSGVRHLRSTLRLLGGSPGKGLGRQLSTRIHFAGCLNPQSRQPSARMGHNRCCEPSAPMGAIRWSACRKTSTGKHTGWVTVHNFRILSGSCGQSNLRQPFELGHLLAQGDEGFLQAACV